MREQNHNVMARRPPPSPSVTKCIGGLHYGTVDFRCFRYRLPPCLRGAVRQEFLSLVFLQGEKFRNDVVFVMMAVLFGAIFEQKNKC